MHPLPTDIAGILWSIYHPIHVPVIVLDVFQAVQILVIVNEWSYLSINIDDSEETITRLSLDARFNTAAQ